jgi:hypothetical protein
VVCILSLIINENTQYITWHTIHVIVGVKNAFDFWVFTLKKNVCFFFISIGVFFFVYRFFCLSVFCVVFYCCFTLLYYWCLEYLYLYMNFKARYHLQLLSVFASIKTCLTISVSNYLLLWLLIPYYTSWLYWDDVWYCIYFVTNRNVREKKRKKKTIQDTFKQYIYYIIFFYFLFHPHDLNFFD